MEINTMFELIISQVPQYFGFGICIYFMWKQLDRQMILIEKLTEQCIEEMDEPDE